MILRGRNVTKAFALWTALATVLVGLTMMGQGLLGSKATDEPLRPKVLVLNFDPVIEAEGSKRLHEVCRFHDPRSLAEGYIADLTECSGGFVQYRIVEWRDVDAFPTKTDGFVYDDATYLRCWRERKGWHEPDSVDSRCILDAFDLVRRVNEGEVDEVWLFGGPYFGFWESHMVGPTAYWCNSPPLKDDRFRRNFVIMGFNYERGVGEMLENFGHRVESILTKVYGRWNHKVPLEQMNTWERFTLYDKVAPGNAACGNVHFAPNSEHDYDWGNKRFVWSTCDDWLNYPALTGKKRLVNCDEWGGGDIRAHHKWWLSHLPKAKGIAPDGKLANWWKYVVDFNRYPESAR
jgi:hypothetical protein